MGPQYKHEEMKVMKKWSQCKGTVTLELDGRMDAKAGQFAMLFVDGVSENPFTVAHNNPLRFTVKARGEDDGGASFSNRLLHMERGDRVKVTGPSGNCYWDLIETSRPVYVFMGGCGAAGLPLLADEMEICGVNVRYLFGARSREYLPRDALNRRFNSKSDIAIEDATCGGYTQGTVLDLVDDEELRRLAGEGGQAIICGPTKMLIAVGDRLAQYLRKEDIIISAEPYMKCGRGVCGSCEVAGYHACTDGPNFRYSDVEAAPDFRSFRRRKSGLLEPL